MGKFKWAYNTRNTDGQPRIYKIAATTAIEKGDVVRKASGLIVGIGDTDQSIVYQGVSAEDHDGSTTGRDTGNEIKIYDNPDDVFAYTPRNTCTATGGSTTTFVDSNLKFLNDDDLNGGFIIIVSCAASSSLNGKKVKISDYTASTGTITLAETLAYTLAADDTCYLCPGPQVIGTHIHNLYSNGEIDWESAGGEAIEIFDIDVNTFTVFVKIRQHLNANYATARSAIYLHEFGIIGDGTEETTNIQKAINYCCSNEKILRLDRNKTYRMQKVDLASNLNLDGNQSTLKLIDDMEIESAYDYRFSIFRCLSNNNIKIKNTIFDGNAANVFTVNPTFSSHNTGIILQDTYNVDIENCKFNNFLNTGIQSAQITTFGVRNLYINRCSFYNDTVYTPGRGIQITQGDNENIRILNCNIENMGEHGIVCYPGTVKVKIIGNVIENTGLQLTGAYSNGASIKLNGVEDGNINMNSCYNSRYAMIHITGTGSKNINIENNVIEGADVQRTGGGITVETPSENVRITNNTLEYHKIKTLGDYAYIDGISVSASNVQIFNNVIYNCENGINTADYILIDGNYIDTIVDKGIKVDGDYNVISKNICSNCDYGIYNAADGTLLIANQYSSNTTADFHKASGTASNADFSAV
jgi:hypothetical protein